MNKDKKDNNISWLKILDKYRNKGESDASFSKRIGANRVALFDWKKGSTPKVETINTIRKMIELSQEDYRDIMILLYGVVVADSKKEQEIITEKTLLASDVPDNHLCKRLLLLRDEKQTARSFIRDMGFTVERWLQLTREDEPRLTFAELKAIGKPPRFNSVPEFLIWGGENKTNVPILEEEARSITRVKKKQPVVKTEQHKKAQRHVHKR